MFSIFQCGLIMLLSSNTWRWKSHEQIVEPGMAHVTLKSVQKVSISHLTVLVYSVDEGVCFFGSIDRFWCLQPSFSNFWKLWESSQNIFYASFKFIHMTKTNKIKEVSFAQIFPSNMGKLTSKWSWENVLKLQNKHLSPEHIKTEDLWIIFYFCNNGALIQKTYTYSWWWDQVWTNVYLNNLINMQEKIKQFDFYLWCNHFNKI